MASKDMPTKAQAKRLAFTWSTGRGIPIADIGYVRILPPRPFPFPQTKKPGTC
jgi:hypothetical protein